MQNFFSNLAPSGGEEGANSGAPWYMKYAGKAAGIGGGLVAVFFGFWCCITLSPLCIVAGIWQICAGLFVITLEAPFCCMFLDFVQKAVAKVDGRPVWQKALVYLVLSIIPFFLCRNYTIFLGSGAIFAVATLNGLMSLGRKASRDEMAASASAGGAGTTAYPKSDSQNSGLVGNIHGQDVEAAKGGGGGLVY